MIGGLSSSRAFTHLPPGREPGIQSLRTRYAFPLWEWAVGLVGAAMAIGGVFVAAGGRGPQFDRTEEALGGAFFAAFGFLAVGLMYSTLRKRRPSSLARRMPGTTLGVEREEARRGDELRVTVTLSPGAARADDPLEVGLVCVERYDYTARAQTKAGPVNVRQTRDATAYERWLPVERAVGEQSYVLGIPAAAPYSYEGECVSYFWRISARAVRRLRADPRSDHPIWVRP
jgi:hypothetical protein